MYVFHGHVQPILIRADMDIKTRSPHELDILLLQHGLSRQI